MCHSSYLENKTIQTYSMYTVMIKNRITLNELETLLTFIMQLVIETFYFQHRPTSQVSKFQTLR
jgi:hypothetical protein